MRIASYIQGNTVDILLIEMTWSRISELNADNGSPASMCRPPAEWTLAGRACMCVVGLPSKGGLEGGGAICLCELRSQPWI